MIPNSIIQKTIDELSSITKTEYMVYDDNCNLLIGTGSTDMQDKIDRAAIESFARSQADSQSVAGNSFLKVKDEDELAYIVVAGGSSDDVYMMGRVAVCQLQSLITAYKERVDRTAFYQNLLLDNMLLVDIHNRATKLHIENDVRRVVYVIETSGDKDNVALELMKNLYVQQAGNQLLSIDEQSIILIKDIDSKTDSEEMQEIAEGIVDTLNTEAMLNVRVSFGLAVNELKDLSRSYKEARMALDVGSIFYTQLKVLNYETLGIGRLIYQLPLNLCEMFVKEVFGESIPKELDEETLNIVYKFFENNLNVSETSRQLYLHRNTLVYKIEKLQKAIGLDMRVFDDALTFKMAMMVVDYVNYMHNREM